MDQCQTAVFDVDHKPRCVPGSGDRCISLRSRNGTQKLSFLKQGLFTREQIQGPKICKCGGNEDCTSDNLRGQDVADFPRL
jgi:hypothetical protein